MKIIQNNHIKTNNNIEYICEHCNSVFEYDEYDICVDSDGDDYIKCPCCGDMCYVNYKHVTKENISFPESFYHFGVNEGAVKIDNEEITFAIRRMIDKLSEKPNEPFLYTATGDTFVCVFNHQDEYYIMVAKNYFDVSIDK